MRIQAERDEQKQNLAQKLLNDKANFHGVLAYLFMVDIRPAVSPSD